MAASDSTPLPIKAQALQITFPMWLTTGLVNSGAAGLDSEISKDNGSFADCTNEATEIGSSGTYTLDLTGTEMNADVVAIQVKSSTTNAITYKITIYPSSGSKMQVNAVQVGSQTASAAGTVTFPGTIASTTNITAGTITTVTNLTNAPTAGDFTSTMKTSLNAATPAVTVSDKTGFSLANGSFVTATFGTCDLTATMKASVTTAATASTPTLAGTQTFNNTGTWTGNITGNLSGSVGSVTSAVTVTGDTATAATRLLTMLVVDGGVYQFTANALELAPTGGSAPTADQNAAALLKLDWTTVSGEASRSVLNALRFLRNGFSISGSTLSVLGEDDTTVVYTRDLATDAAAIPIVGVS